MHVLGLTDVRWRNSAPESRWHCLTQAYELMVQGYG